VSEVRHTYESPGGVEVALILPEEFEAPESITIRRASDGRDGVVRRVRSRRAPTRSKTKPVAARTIPDDFAVTDEMRDWAAREVPSINVDVMTAEFVTYWQGLGRPMADWAATWRNSMQKRHRWNVEKGWKPKSRATPRDEDARAKWCREHGLTVEEYEARKGDAEWLDMIKRRGVVSP